MPFRFISGDIAAPGADAVVCFTAPSLPGEDGGDPGLPEVCRVPETCGTAGGRYVLRVPAPLWQGGDRGEILRLAACCRSCLSLAVQYGCETVAFPLIDSGWPADRAIRETAREIGDFLRDRDLTVFLVVGDRKRLRENRKSFPALEERLRGPSPSGAFKKVFSGRLTGSAARETLREDLCAGAPRPAAEAVQCRPGSLEEAVENLDESFQQMLLRKIDERGMTDAQCYKKANIDRKLFSKIRNDVHYRPSKATALAFAVALEMSPGETDDLLEKAGYALSRSSRFDVIVRFFIERGEYDIFRINEALFTYDQSLLGS